VFAGSLLGVDALAVLLGGGLIGALWLRGISAFKTGEGKAAAILPPVLAKGLAAVTGSMAATAAEVPLWRLGLFFLKIGAILYGSGYVLVAFLEKDLVGNLGWLTQPQLLDAIAIGQFTPGPVLSTATFIGYLIAGVPGAIAATLGIFLPSFLFVLILNPIIPRLREMAWTAAFLDAVNAAAVALMLAVTIALGRETLVNWQAWVILGLAALLAFRFKLNSAWLVLGGAVLGYALNLL
jgi:chromate transporter